MSARKATVILSPDAEDDLEDIFQYGRDQLGDYQATIYADALSAAIERLEHFPHLGRSQDERRPARRSSRVRQHVIHYRIDDDRVTVLRILHARLDAVIHLTDEDDNLS